jgi:uncharacterized protein (TIGR00299 family) protein
MIAYFDCFSGIAGDMTVAALLDAGLNWDALRAELGKLPLDGYEIERTTVTRSAISATYFRVVTTDKPSSHSAHHHGRHLSDIETMIAGGALPQTVRDNAIAIFRKLGEAEAHVHGVPIESIHFHEVGAVDSIVDIVGACIGFHEMGISQVYASPLPVGRGMVKTAHGLMPVPAPATAALCAGIPTYPVDVAGELVTPTGAAILATLAKSFGPPPPMSSTRIGYGAGTKDFGERPNLLRITLAAEESQTGSVTEQLLLLETNIDDMNPQVYDDVMRKCFDAGALDVTFTPVQMKKNRPAVTLSVLCDASRREEVLQTLFRHTTTLGIRVSAVERVSLAREIVQVETEFGTVTVKAGIVDADYTKVHAEYESARNAAEKSGAPVMEVMRAAEEAFKRQ